MGKSRSKQAIINTGCELAYEFALAICNFILPRLILVHFGSVYNGITQSITQFIGCIALLQSGIGGVTRAALYGPLAKRDQNGISEVVNATAQFMRKVASIFAIAVLGFAVLYPFLVSDDFSWFFSFTLVIILSISTFAQYFFGITYQMVLKADQKMYIISLVQIASTIVNTIISALLIYSGFGIHGVKLGSAIVFIFPPIFYNIYVTKKYRIDKKIRPKLELLSQRWDAFGHQIANFINNNTDIMVTTVILGVREVSVYSVHYMIGNAIKKVVMALGSGMSAAFGNMLAKKETKILEERFNQFEIVIFFSTSTLVVITAIMITPFISVYTKGVTDVNYIRPTFGYLISIAIYFGCLKIPYEELIYAAGHFKSTRNGAFVEAGINIVLSIFLAMFIGLNGVVVGTFVAMAYRTIRYYFYVCNNLIDKPKHDIFIKILYSVTTAVIAFGISKLLPLGDISGYVEWIGWASAVSLLTLILSTVIGLLVFGKQMIGTLKYILRIFGRRGK